MYEKKTDNSILFASKAQIKHQIDILPNIAISRWQVNKCHVNYQKDDLHTLSMYVKGGENSYRSDQPDNKGAPGKIVFMPQGHESNWSINGKIDFVHLYFSDKTLKQFATTQLNCDVRSIDLKDVTYENDLILQRLFKKYYSYCERKSNLYSLFAEETLSEIFNHIITQYNGYKIKLHNPSSGLSLIHRKKIKFEINERLGEKLSIEKLANTIKLSSFHFSRMFKLSFGETPAQYINQIRIAKVKQYLTSSLCLAEISLLTGFNQQSHMSHHFKQQIGVTPRIYQKLCG